MSANTKTAVGERLPYLLAKLKAPRVFECLEQTAARAREEHWPYEQSSRRCWKPSSSLATPRAHASASATPRPDPRALFGSC